MAQPFTALIMAAGQGTRMKSALPKVLHPVCGVPMVHWVIAAARAAGADRVVVVTRPGDGVAEHLPEGAESAPQSEGEGTGSAVLAARDALEQSHTVVVLSGDVPLVKAETIEGLVDKHHEEGAVATLLTTDELDPTAYGRIIRDGDGSVNEIVETKRTEGVAQEVLDTREINIGTYAFAGPQLVSALEEVGQTDGEVYLTGVFPVFRRRGLKVAAYKTGDTLGAMGVNTRADLIEVTRHAQRRILSQHAREGVTFTSPDSVEIHATVEIGEDTTIAAGVTLRGHTRVGARCLVGPQSTLTDAELGDGVSLLHSVLAECRVADGATVGPFAYLRPEADVRDGAKIGTFVEVKKSVIGAGAKIPHLSYIGDADVGEKANVGGGAITANYHRGVKNRTTIGRDARTGVHNSFVAPVSVGDSAYTGAGSVITEDVPDGALGVSRAPQENIEGYRQRLDQKQEQK
ncbi:MAG: bifunctional UDP-N-acetylglucosamine pyrophosphorylase / glucosamine-phosphate N-acetyltransferase [Thermoleophilaceae bacterium]|nr:bifunctional UDP-N-acetylglucosamine pyrophosphorylase / glucosamine-phosphate N-acetyltransferase [Thermoleophilaceae bacterium]